MLLATFSGNAPIVPAGYLFHNTQSVVSRSVPNSYHLNVDIRTIRRTNFESLIEEAGGIAPLAKRCGASEKYLRNIYNGFISPDAKSPKQVGDKTARSLEKGMSKSYGWMDVDHASQGFPPEVSSLLQTITTAASAGALTPEQAAAFDALIKTTTANK